MPAKISLTRRQLLHSAALGVLALPLLGAVSSAAAEKALPSGAGAEEGREHGLRLGVASYSTRMLSLDETIATLKVLRIVNAGLYKTHLAWDTASVDECRAVREKLRRAGMTITGSGVINLPDNDAALRRIFENAKAGGLAAMVCKPDLAALPRVERFVREFDQKVAIHNHGPEDKVYPSPADVWRAIEGLDARIGLCLDVGHAARAGADPAGAIRQYAPRVYDIHMKDTVAVAGATKDIPAEVGAGRLDIRGILRALRDIGYSGVVAFEYEKVAANPVTGLAESIGYVRGLLAGMGEAA